MVTNRLLLWQLKRVFTLYAYYLTYGIRAHRLIRDIDVWLVGCGDIFAFEAIAEKAHKRDPATDAPPLIHFLGGSSYGAFQDLEEMRIWIKKFVEGLALHTAIVALHLGMSGRCDFHVLSPNLMADGRALYHADLREKARALARELTTQLNERRLRLGLLPIGNLTPEGEVFFLDPRLELVAPPTAPAVAENLAKAGEAPLILRTHLPQATPLDHPSVLPLERAEPQPLRQKKPLIAPQPAPVSPPKPVKPAASAAPERDLASLAAAAQTEYERQQAKARKQRDEAEAEAKKRTLEEAYARFLRILQRLQLIAPEANALGDQINGRVNFLREANPQDRLDDPKLRSLLEESRRWLGDAATQAALTATFASEADDSQELLQLKRTCSETHGLARAACADLTHTVTAVTAVLEIWRREIEEKRRGLERT
jgi:hypothetical protein